MDFSHLDAEGRPAMVDIGAKPETSRRAVARATVDLPDSVLAAAAGQDILTPKGSVFQTAILAGTMAAKKTWDLIPLCHPLPLDACQIVCRLEGRQAIIEATVATRSATGVEMEALTAVSVAALTVYDMAKALSHEIVIRDIRLLEKTGGRSNFKAEKDAVSPINTKS
jgi:cyclic pyranopterin monophosphate synthase